MRGPQGIEDGGKLVAKLFRDARFDAVDDFAYLREEATCIVADCIDLPDHGSALNRQIKEAVKPDANRREIKAGGSIKIDGSIEASIAEAMTVCGVPGGYKPGVDELVEAAFECRAGDPARICEPLVRGPADRSRRRLPIGRLGQVDHLSKDCGRGWSELRSRSYVV